MKILLFPGSFNPMNFGHLRLLRAAIEDIKPDVSIVSPTYNSSADQPDFAVRCEIARTAVNNTLPLPLSEMVEVGTFHHTKDDASLFSSVVVYYQDFYKNPDIWILLGGQGACEARKWKYPKDISSMAQIAMARSVSKEDAAWLEAKGFQTRILPFKPSPINSERVRSVLEKGQQDHWRYVPRAVFHFLEERGLYGVKGAGCAQ